MAETIDEILERLKNPGAGAVSGPVVTPLKDAPKIKADGVAAPLSPAHIIGGAFIFSPKQISFIAENMAKDIADSLNMRAVLPKIKITVEKALIDALRAARKQGTN
ncbi:MAG: hypothetical protein FWC83_02200 [Alphaproteobacteria bacterium]|nr:hypothetical protein [Alphaproteobacteria bacterium]